ncbi:Hypothetical protein R9X50_00133300 [Acrodontium crateriforme]|uniref:JmjC domain-containing protein n=1 Tax=Acrodontium crateriforme TaxID=150365 RepID=A0AAQ3LYW2_9PEZI|nr:Hypothetical protein R9X50_00133300 [Acrodontium crateriforme]
MPAQRPRASFEPLAPNFDLFKFVENTPNFDYVTRIPYQAIEEQGMAAFEKLVLMHVIVSGKPLVVDGFEDQLDPWTFTPKWLRDNCGEKVENARMLSSQKNLPLSIGHYLENMGKLTNQFFDRPGAYKEKNRQRAYLKDIDCPDVWQQKLKEKIPNMLFYLNESTGDPGGPGAVPELNGPAGRQLGKGISRAGDLMSALPPDMRAENLMCYIGHEGTYTPAHREMCASLGQNIMVEASGTVSEDGKAERPGSSIWFMTESKDRHIVSEYWLSVLGHDIEVEDHFAQLAAWKKAPFNVYIVEQRPGDLILIPPLAPHQVWNRGTRTMKVAWNRTTVETLEMALNEALPRSRIVCRDEQYKNKAIVYYTLQKYASSLTLAQQQATGLSAEDARRLLYRGKIKALQKDFKRLFALYKQILLSEMFSPDGREAPKSIEYLPFDSNVTCAYCRSNIFNRFLTCPSCKDVLGHDAEDGDPYDVCMDCYAMGRSCACISNLKWVEQFRWKELASKYDIWRKLIISLDGGENEKTPLSLIEEKERYGKKSLAEVCKEQLKRRPWVDVNKQTAAKTSDDEDEEIIVDDNGMVKKTKKKRSKAWLQNNTSCHICCNRHPKWKMAACTKCDRSYCYGSLFRGWDKMPIEIMEDSDWSCPHCLGICFAGACRREGKMEPYEPKGTLLGHDTKKVADIRSVEALVDFSVSNLNWLKDDDAVDRTESSRVKRAKAEAEKAKAEDLELDEDRDADAELNQTGVNFEYTQDNDQSMIDPALGGGVDEDVDAALARRLQQANSALVSSGSVHMDDNSAPREYEPMPAVGYVPEAEMYPHPGVNSYSYPNPVDVAAQPADSGIETVNGLRPFKRIRDPDNDDINMQKHPKAKKPRMQSAGFRSSDLADGTISRAKSEVQRQFEKEKERKALDKAKAQGRFIMLSAALRGKKRIVVMKISGARLAQAMAQQATSMALRTNKEQSPSNEVQDENDDSGDMSLLQSDVVPKKPKAMQEYHQQRQRDGLVITSKTKKARIPVERDENYDGRVKNGKQKLDAVDRRKSRNSATVDYEEVDIGSDEDEAADEEQATVSHAQNRRLPTYLQERHAGNEELPGELSDDLESGISKQKPKRAAPTSVPATSSGASFIPPKKKYIGRPAGKRPTMRPVQAPFAIEDANSGGMDDVIQISDDEGSNDSSALMAQQTMNEANRVAKLQALEMLDAVEQSGGEAGNQANYNLLMAAQSDGDSDVDGADSVPAR